MNGPVQDTPELTGAKTVDYLTPSHQKPAGSVDESTWHHGFPMELGIPLLDSIVPALRQIQEHVIPTQQHRSIQQFQTFLASRPELTQASGHDSAATAAGADSMNGSTSMRSEASKHKIDAAPEWIQMGKALPYFGASVSLPSVMAWAMMYLCWMSVLKQKSQCAIILDIDDTILTCISGQGSEYASVVIEPVKRLYLYALSLGISVYFVTARRQDPSNLAFTIKELHSLGFNQFTALFLMPASYVSMMRDPQSAYYRDISRYKYEARRYIAQVDGKDLLLSIGDMWADLLLDSIHLDMTPHKHSAEVLEATKNHAQVADFLTRRLPTDMHYILKLPDVAMMSIKVRNKDMSLEI
jgi:hypothetical protein